MELVYYPTPRRKKMLLTMATLPLPPLASSAMSAATASAVRTRVVIAKSRDGGTWHFLLPSLSPSPPPWSSLAHQLVIASMPSPLILSSRLCLCLLMRNLSVSKPHRLLFAGASSHICLSFAGWLSHRLLLLHLCLASPFVARPPHASIPDPPPLRSCRLVVALHLFAPPPSLNALMPHNWLW